MLTLIHSRGLTFIEGTLYILCGRMEETPPPYYSPSSSSSGGN